MNNLDKIQTFTIFCLEAYRKKYNMSGSEVLDNFQKHDVFKFLENGYEVLHTQSMEYVTSEIFEYINFTK